MPNSFRDSCVTVSGIIRREWAFQNKFFGQRLQRLLLGPLMSAGMAWLLYGGIFRQDQGVSLGGVNHENFRPWLVVSFLIHSYLNQGYYFFSNKLLNEWWSRTLSLLYLSPQSPWILFLGFSGLEYFRSFILTVLVATALWWSGYATSAFLLQLGAVFPALLGLGLVLGLMKGAIAIQRQGKGEIFDPVFWILIFTSGLYIPRELLPAPLSMLAELNPVFQVQRALLTGAHDWTAVAVIWLVFLSGLTLSLFLAATKGHRILEKSYS